MPNTEPDLREDSAYQRAREQILEAARTNSKVIYLRGRQLKLLPPEIGECTTLERLDLGINRLTTLPPEIGRCTALQGLNLEGNELNLLPPELGQCTALKNLYLRENQLSILTPEICKCTVLDWLDLRSNDALGLPPEILATKDARKILDYYFTNRARQFGAGTEPLNEAKVLVLGEPKVGKTSLIYAITEGCPTPHFEKTDGIVRKSWKVLVEDGRVAKFYAPNVETLRLNFWDFGGQEIYKSTHTFFLTRRSVYLLVADARGSERQNNLEYWLEMARSFGGDAPIWIAINKCDQGGGGLNREALLRKYAPQLRGFIETSCQGKIAGQGIAELQGKLINDAWGIPEVRQPMNRVWLGIKRALEEMTEQTLTVPSYCELCQQCGETDPQMQRRLLDLWDKLGTVRYFSNSPEESPWEICETAILNPEWVTVGVYAVLDDERVAKNNGLITEADLARIAQAKNYAEGGHHFIRHVMRRFDLLYALDDPNQREQRMFVPLLLPELEPKFDWPIEKTLRFIYRYPVLPAGLIPAFIARMHKFLSNAPGPWRKGCVLNLRSCRARVVSDAESKQVEISVDGMDYNCRETLDVIRFTFESIHAGIKGLEETLEELIPVPGHPQAPFVSYRFLLNLEASVASPNTFPARGANANEIVTVNVKQALGGVRGQEKAEYDLNKSRELNTIPGPQIIHMGPHIHINESPNVGVVVGNESQVGDDNRAEYSPGSALGRGAQAKIGGDINVGLAGEAIAALLATLQREGDTLVAQLPEEKKQSAKDGLTLLQTAVKSEPPNRTWYSMSAQGLLDASKWVKNFTGNIVGVIGQLGKALWPDFLLPKIEKE